MSFEPKARPAGHTRAAAGGGQPVDANDANAMHTHDGTTRLVRLSE